ncbi:MAG TPA: hypothetical protein VEB21_11590, partial [Terriglobales bacterium]|nr:hypothetical protein [Terriglobales bacterium]
MKVFFAVILLLEVLSSPIRAQLATCGEQDDPKIADAWRRIEASVDPCGEHVEIQEVLETIRRCNGSSYRVCTSVAADRNTFDPPSRRRGSARVGTITWNPTLRTELEAECDGDSDQPVRRDPTASLLHELVHAAQDCQDLEASELEMEAVRIENIYRRAAGLCQRTRYGEEPLPAQFTRACSPGRCSCERPSNGLQMAREGESKPAG